MTTEVFKGEIYMDLCLVVAVAHNGRDVNKDSSLKAKDRTKDQIKDLL